MHQSAFDCFGINWLIAAFSHSAFGVFWFDIYPLEFVAGFIILIGIIAVRQRIQKNSPTPQT